MCLRWFAGIKRAVIWQIYNFGVGSSLHSRSRSRSGFLPAKTPTPIIAVVKLKLTRGESAAVKSTLRPHKNPVRNVLAQDDRKMSSPNSGVRDKDAAMGSSAPFFQAGQTVTNKRNEYRWKTPEILQCSPNFPEKKTSIKICGQRLILRQLKRLFFGGWWGWHRISRFSEWRFSIFFSARTEIIFSVLASDRVESIRVSNAGETVLEDHDCVSGMYNQRIEHVQREKCESGVFFHQDVQFQWIQCICPWQTGKKPTTKKPTNTYIIYYGLLPSLDWLINHEYLIIYWKTAIDRLIDWLSDWLTRANAWLIDRLVDSTRVKLLALKKIREKNAVQCMAIQKTAIRRISIRNPNTPLRDSCLSHCKIRASRARNLKSDSHGTLLFNPPVSRTTRSIFKQYVPPIVACRSIIRQHSLACITHRLFKSSGQA